MNIAIGVLAATAGLSLLPAMLLLVQVLAAILPHRRKENAAASLRPRIAVLVPAHNESAVIADSLRRIVSQLQPGDRLIVVADNCLDDTAAIASAQGAEVLLRRDSARRGKGYALDCGMRYLEADPPELVIIVDADCQVEQGALDRVARRAAATGGPVQALYLMRNPPGAPLSARLAEFAWTIKNWVRPLGYSRLGLPCQLMGTGMAFPWRLVSALPLADGHLVEDMKMGIDAALRGHAPVFCVEAMVSSQFPDRADAKSSQRTRWEHGHLAVIRGELPRLLQAAIRRRDLRLLALALDLALPPLALFVLIQVVLSCAGLIAGGASDAVWPAILGALPLTLTGVAVVLAWRGWGRNIVPFRALLATPAYALRKLPLYLRFLFHPQRSWVKTERR